jgi:peptidoglycan biosynthesis protein MviN/MurJ (putative lipid II flippase)
MYEIWLMLNIVWEIALGVWPLLLGAALLWLALISTAWRTAGSHWRAGLLPALLIGVAVAVAAFLLLPGSLHSTLSDMGYWLDWVTLLGLAAAVGGAGAAFAWPLLAWRHGQVKA